MTESPSLDRPLNLDAGRLLFAQPATFLAGAPTLETLPVMQGMEIAFAGRSNVGKSSLINALTNRKALARTSHTPGRTQELNFFRLGEKGLIFVDMPGYGYAAAPEAKVKAWTQTIRTYLRGRATLVRVYLLIDARHGVKPLDETVLEDLDKNAVSYQVVLTKVDALKKPELESRIAQTLESLSRRPAAHPRVVSTSSRDDHGVAELRAEIARLVLENAPRRR